MSGFKCVEVTEGNNSIANEFSCACNDIMHHALLDITYSPDKISARDIPEEKMKNDKNTQVLTNLLGDFKI
ncbi:MAG: hypothetical protein DI626_02245 [Micavibrio aeruginosavorus]|uniref:Uncharacterized protein n=1 Tax=Micavibrio aeruginosavorus TaxID=349221 RepID=A0A2W5A4K2_9BACT|nr:MAG: hypothetical protein DI626_02245 [Micavibrio aeruginosavorus]